MEQNIFDLNLEEFFNSESASIDVTEVKTIEPKQDKQTTNTATSNEDDDTTPVVNTLSLDEIANYDEADDNEEVITVAKDKAKTPVVDNDSTSSSDNNQLSSLAQGLIEAGVFSSLTEEEVSEIKDENSFVKALEAQIKKNELADLNEDQRSYLEALRNGVPHETYTQRTSNAAIYEKITDEQIEESQPLQVELLKRNFLAKGFSDSDASKYANMALRTEEGIEDAKKAKVELANLEKKELQKEVDKAKQNRAEKERSELEKISALKSKVNEKSSIIEGVTFNAQTKDNIFKSITSPVKMKDETPLNEVLAAYEEDMDYKIRLHYMHTITKGFTDFSKLNKESKTKATKGLSDLINKNTMTSNSGVSAQNNRGATSNNLLEALDSIFPNK